MLGRLFKLSSMQSINPTPQGTSNKPSGSSPSTLSSHDDSYTREVLYGTQTQTFKTVAFNPRKFRLVVAQDGGHLRNKQVLYDSAASVSALPSPLLSPTSGSAPSGLPQDSHLNPQKQSSQVWPAAQRGTSTKEVHNVNELNDYMFGRGLPSNEQNSATKVHLLPEHGVYPAVLITKLFLIIDANSSFWDSENVFDPAWFPQSAVPVKETYFNFSSACTTPGDGHMRTQTSFNLRFAIGIVIPLSRPDLSVEELLAAHWDVLSYYLVVLQKIVTKKLLLALKYSTINSSCPYINNRRICFPSSILQTDLELPHQLHKLIKLVGYNTNTPRMISTHLLMRHSIRHSNSRFRSMVINWALEVINWLEFKDGRNFVTIHPQGVACAPNVSQNSFFQQDLTRAESSQALTNTFLASLLTLILPMRHLLCAWPMSPNSDMAPSKDISRVVIMTGNSMVSKKLIFILSGLIPDFEFSADLEEEPVLEMAHENGSSEGFADDLLEDTTVECISPVTSPGFIRNSSPLVKPIPIRQQPVTKMLQEPLSASASSTKGWEVPVKTAASLSFSGPKPCIEGETRTTTAAQLIPVHRRSSASNSLSLAYLSSSLNSSLSSSASNYSLSKFGNSFMEKWKHSLGKPVHTPNHEMSDPFMYDISKRPPFIHTKSPSPALEHDPIWEAPIRESPTAMPGSPVRQRCSRTQSMLNLFSGTPTRKTLNGDLPLFNICRSTSSVYLPITSESEAKIASSNRDCIRLKLMAIMNSKSSFGNQEGPVLTVNPAQQHTSSSSTFIERSTITSDPEKDCLMRPVFKRSFLHPNVAFVEEFRPEYVVQSCPVNPKLEAQVVSAMKNDLLFFQNNCNYERVTSKTVFVSLRAREIKLIEMSVGAQDRGNGPFAAMGSQVTPPLSTQSPLTSYFHAAEVHGPRGGAGGSYRTTTKKVFSPHRNSGDKEAINRVESQLDKLTDIVSMINNDADATTDTKEDYNRMLFEAVAKLIE